MNMSILSFLAGMTLLILGAIALPTPPATPKVVELSGAPTALFFGGAFVICAIFIKKHHRHGKIGAALLSVAGLFFSLYKILPPLAKSETLTAPNIHLPLLLCSAIIAALSWAKWRNNRGVKVN